MRVFSTWTQSPSRLVAVNCVPLGAAPRTGAFLEGADLMFTLGRCKKTISRFCVAGAWRVSAFPADAVAAVWGELPVMPEGEDQAKRRQLVLIEMVQGCAEPPGPERRVRIPLLERLLQFPSLFSRLRLAKGRTQGRLQLMLRRLQRRQSAFAVTRNPSRFGRCRSARQAGKDAPPLVSRLAPREKNRHQWVVQLAI